MIGEGRPGGNTTKTANQLTTANAEFTATRHHDRHEPLTAEDRADLDVLIAASERGFRLATRCIRCGQWLVAPSSVRAHMGAVCRSKAATA
jgi:hypothetical protein